METLRRLSLAYRRCFLALAVMALAVRALVPAGWMTMPSADGTVRLTICTGTGPIAATPAMAHEVRAMSDMGSGMGSGMGPAPPHHGDDAPTHPDHPCAFTGGVLAAALPVLIQPPAPPPVATAIRLAATRDLAVGRGLAAPPPPPTGPPAFA